MCLVDEKTILLSTTTLNTTSSMNSEATPHNHKTLFMLRFVWGVLEC